MTDPRTRAVGERFDDAVRTLEHLVAIPGVSASSYPAAMVRRSADEVAGVLRGWGFDGVRLLETSGHPAVYGEVVVATDAPAVLVYGHHDVQPPGRDDRWISPPFEPAIRDGRMFGRGTADDKGGFLAYATAVRACAEEGTLPCNVKVLIEGEEEIGSPHLADLLRDQRELFESDYIVLCDTPNFDTGVPALTYRLRGNCIVDVEIRCLDRPVHSGQGGGALPDSVMILCRVLGSLQNADGTLNIPGLDDRVVVDEVEREMIRRLPFDAERWARQSGILDCAAFMRAGNVRERIWTRPSLTITALESVPMAQAANQISDAARARLSLRTVPDLDSREAGEMLVRALRERVPGGARLTVSVAGGPEPWVSDPNHAVYAAARRALTRGFGAEAVMTGSGGSIGFVAPFAGIAGDVPPLLTGVQDPISSAHSENESLHLGDFRKAMNAAVHLFDELAALGRRKGQTQ